jgi:16S rRNA (guanine1516-N2)-methyltransferase
VDDITLADRGFYRFGVELVRDLAAGFLLETVVDERDPSTTRLILREVTQSDDRPLSVAVDFLDARILYRLTHGFGPGQTLGRALGVKKSSSALRVLDGTAGLGTDAFFIAALGCRVRAIERSPVVAALLLDGYRRLVAAASSVENAQSTSRFPLEQLQAIIRNLTFEEGTTHQVLAEMAEDERPDVIFLDPMFPDEGRSESALPKKTMQIFRRLIGTDDDSAQLLELALLQARFRVVVKRPLPAPYLAERKANASFVGKSSRLDMYLCTGC